MAQKKLNGKNLINSVEKLNTELKKGKVDIRNPKQSIRDNVNDDCQWQRWSDNANEWHKFCPLPVDVSGLSRVQIKGKLTPDTIKQIAKIGGKIVDGTQNDTECMLEIPNDKLEEFEKIIK